MQEGPPPLGGKGGEGGEGRGEGNVRWAALSPPFPSLLPFPPLGRFAPPTTTAPAHPTPRSLRVRLSEKGGPALRDPPLGHRTLRSRLPADVPEVPSLFLSFSEKGKNEKMGLFLAIQKIKFKKNQKKVVATSFLNFKNY